MELLREDQVAPAFRRMAAGMDACIAAPFWGEGAADLRPAGATGRLRVLCRFGATACNPAALLPLALSGVEIRSHPRLHAKIYTTRTRAIVGSSNPSRYGLTREGDALGGSVEANILTDDARTVSAVLRLFEELWTSDETSPVSAEAIRAEIAARVSAPP